MQPVAAVPVGTPAYNMVPPMPISPLRGQMSSDVISTPSTPVIIQIEAVQDGNGQNSVPRVRKPPLPILSLTTLSATKSSQNVLEGMSAASSAYGTPSAASYPVVTVATTPSSAAAAAAAAAAGALAMVRSPVSLPTAAAGGQPRSTPVVNARECNDLAAMG